MSDLMTLEEIAAIHHCSERHARDVIVKTPRFPAGITDQHAAQETMGAQRSASVHHEKARKIPARPAAARMNAGF